MQTMGASRSRFYYRRFGGQAKNTDIQKTAYRSAENKRKTIQKHDIISSLSL
jgi:hypothetical protein